MSAEQFFNESTGKNAEEAFKKAVEQAAYDHGHSGYTGTIAEKDEFVMIRLPKKYKCLKKKDEAAYEYAQELINTDDKRIEDKWGPAGCIKWARNKYLFFGWASS